MALSCCLILSVFRFFFTKDIVYFPVDHLFSTTRTHCSFSSVGIVCNHRNRIAKIYDQQLVTNALFDPLYPYSCLHKIRLVHTFTPDFSRLSDKTKPSVFHSSDLRSE
ncbi:hypothetical protein CSKR_200492 [Clonorchis sinensis]|uniref:Secreted protein n=1 Tax=Clonorchis sinensis TaxID=79923 RepID=A0A8T1MDZ3_CLOSI|nr:hypothetical protein CSKR_200492 [Clonorchis sinensis]